MNTPTFECSQTDTHVIIEIRVPYIDIKEVEYVINGAIFRFYAKPYFLRLNFPYELDTSGKTDSTNYNIDTHIFTAKIGKIKPNLFYPNLHMLTKLLQKPKSKVPTRPLIEVLSSEISEDLKVSPAESFHWEQTLNPPKNELFGSNEVSHGFNLEYKNVFSNNQDLLSMIELSSPETSIPEERQQLMISQMKKEFMSDHIIFDLINFGEVQKRINFVPYYIAQSMDPQFSQKFKWIEDEKRVLTSLPKKEYLISNHKNVWICLLDILASYCYNERVNLGQENSESAWNISKICSSFSWLIEHQSMDMFCKNFVLRVLCYPFIRNFDFAIGCLNDVSKILLKKEMLLRCLLQIRKKFIISDYNIFFKIFLNDYCVWVQSVPSEHIEKVREMLLKSIQQTVRNKYEVAKVFCLKEVEEFAIEEINEAKKSRQQELLYEEI